MPKHLKIATRRWLSPRVTSLLYRRFSTPALPAFSIVLNAGLPLATLLRFGRPCGRPLAASAHATLPPPSAFPAFVTRRLSILYTKCPLDSCCQIMKTPVVAAILIATQLLTVAFLVVALLAPDYHKEALIIPGGNSLAFSLSLFTVKCASNCLPFFAGIPSVAMSQHNQAYIRVCQSLVESLNQKSLQEVTHFLCGVSIAFYGLPETGCTAFQAVSSASLFLIWFLGIAIVCAIFSLCSLIGFFAFAPTLLMRRSIVGSQLSTAIFGTCGALMYILIGGCISPTLLAGAVFGTNISHGFHWSFSAGLAVLLAAMTWTWVVPLWSIWAIKHKYVIDYISSTAWMEDEARSLIHDIRQEGYQLQASSCIPKPAPAPPPYCNYHRCADLAFTRPGSPYTPQRF